MGIIPGILTALGLNKTVAYLIEIAVAAAVVIGATLYVVHLHNKAVAFDALSAERYALEVKYGCNKRPSIAERDLSTCLVARELDGARAAKQQADAAAVKAAEAQAKFDAETFAATQQQRATDSAIDVAARDGDGPVPPVLLDYWRRLRAARGMK